MLQKVYIIIFIALPTSIIEEWLDKKPYFTLLLEVFIIY